MQHRTRFQQTSRVGRRQIGRVAGDIGGDVGLVRMVRRQESAAAAEFLGEIEPVDGMVQYRAVTRDDLAAPQPAIFFHVDLDRDVDEDAIAGRRYGGCRDIEHQVGFAESPFGLGPDEFGQRIAVAVDRGAGFHPGDDVAHVFTVDQAVIDELADMSVDLAGRHAAGHQHLADHRRPAADHGVAVHGERRDAAGAMAACAILGQHRRDVLTIGRNALDRVFDHGARGFDQRRADGCAIEIFVQGSPGAFRRATILDGKGAGIV